MNKGPRYQCNEGDIFGNFTVIEPNVMVDATSKLYRTLVKCSCGTESLKSTRDLIKRTSEQCSSCANIKSANLGRVNDEKRICLSVGEVFGDWVIIDGPFSPSNLYKVKCKCGSERTIRPTHLKSGYSTCCKKCGSDSTRKGIGDLSGRLLNQIKKGCSNRGKGRIIEFNVTKEYLWELFLKQEKKCALSGIDIVLSYTKGETTASLDRIKSSKGYVEGNVQWVHKDINIMKGALTENRFKQLCKLITKHANNTNSTETSL